MHCCHAVNIVITRVIWLMKNRLRSVNKLSLQCLFNLSSLSAFEMIQDVSQLLITPARLSAKLFPGSRYWKLEKYTKLPNLATMHILQPYEVRTVWNNFKSVITKFLTMSLWQNTVLTYEIAVSYFFEIAFVSFKKPIKLSVLK